MINEIKQGSLITFNMNGKVKLYFVINLIKYKSSINHKKVTRVYTLILSRDIIDSYDIGNYSEFDIFEFYEFDNKFCIL